MPNFASPVSQKTFYKGDKVQLKWNDHGTSLIVLAQTEVDKTGKSYYGETTLYLLSANGGFDSRIDLGEQWEIRIDVLVLILCQQTRKAQSTTSLGLRIPKNLVWSTAICLRRRRSSTLGQSQPTPSRSNRETPFSSPHMAASSLSPDSATLQDRPMFTIWKRIMTKFVRSRPRTPVFASGVQMENTF